MFKKKDTVFKEQVEGIKDKKKKNIFVRIGKVISGVILGILITLGALLVIIFIMGKIAQKQGNYAPISLFTIISPSMTPNINVYDVVVVKNTNPAKIKVGDVISFYSVNDFFDNTPITHRVIEVYNTTTGGIQFRTKGDANSAVDSELALANNVIGTVLFKIPQLGRVQFFLASKGGWFIAILIPALAVIAYDIFKVFKLFRVKKKISLIEKANNESSPIVEEKNLENYPEVKEEIVDKQVNENLQKEEIVEPESKYEPYLKDETEIDDRMDESHEETNPYKEEIVEPESKYEPYLEDEAEIDDRMDENHEEAYLYKDEIVEPESKYEPYLKDETEIDDRMYESHEEANPYKDESVEPESKYDPYLEDVPEIDETMFEKQTDIDGHNDESEDIPIQSLDSIFRDRKDDEK